MEFNHNEKKLNNKANYNYYIENEENFSFDDNEISFKYKFIPNKDKKYNFIDNNRNVHQRIENYYTYKNSPIKMKRKNLKNTNNIYQNSYKDQNLFLNLNYFNNNNLINNNHNILNNQYKNIRYKENFINNNNNNYMNANLRRDDNIYNSININDNYIFNQIKQKNQNNKIDDNFSLNNYININNDIKYGKKLNLKNNDRFPNKKDNYDNFINNKIQTKIKKRKIEEKYNKKNEDESLTKIADDLYNYILEQNEEEKPKLKNNNIIKNINLNKEFERGINININTKFFQDYKIPNNNHNNLNNLNNINICNFNQSKFNNKKYDIFQKNNDEDKSKKNIIKKDEFEKYNISPLKSSNKIINISEEVDINEIKIINNEDSKYLGINEIFDNHNNQDENNFRLKMDYESEKKENNKKVRKVQFDFNKNIYFNFLRGGELHPCQVRKGPNGNLEYLKQKNEESDFNINIGFMKKSCIKPFNKDEIKVNKNYKLYENMEENEIINNNFFGPPDNDNDFSLNITIVDNFDNNFNSDSLINRLQAIFGLDDSENNDLNISSNLSINADISTEYSLNPSSIHSDSDNQ